MDENNTETKFISFHKEKLIIFHQKLVIIMILHI